MTAQDAWEFQAVDGKTRRYYEVSEAMADLLKRFTFHPAQGDQAERYEKIRAEALNMAMDLTGYCPPSRELSLALTKLEEVVFWANAAIARNES